MKHLAPLNLLKVTHILPISALAIMALTDASPAAAATTLPVGPIPFATDAEYDSNFKEAATNNAISRNAGGFLQLSTATSGAAVYDTSSTGGSGGSGGTSGSDANNDLQNFTISSDVSFSAAATGNGANNAGFLLRLDSSEAGGYLALVRLTAVGAGTSSVRFQLLSGASLTAAGSVISGSQADVTGLTLDVGTFYKYSVTVQGNQFTFDFNNGAATNTFTDTGNFNLSAGQAGIRLGAASAETTRLDNFAIVPEPSSLALGLMGAAGCLLARRRRK